jgi:hypothetical protein
MTNLVNREGYIRCVNVRYCSAPTMLLYLLASLELSGSPLCCDSFSVEERGVADGLHDNMLAR